MWNKGLLALCLVLILPDIVVAETAELAFKEAGNGTYRFDTGVLRGALRAENRSVGLLSLEHIPSGTRLDGNNHGILSHYRVFTANRRYGNGAWDWPSTSKLNPDGTVEVHWPAAEDRPFELKALYRLASPDTIDLTTSVTAHEGLKSFESFLASYFAPAFHAASVCIKAEKEDGPVFQTTEKEQGVWQAFPRERAVVPLIQDGRWRIEPNPVDWVLREDAPRPLALRRHTQTGVCAVLMAPPEDCFAVMTPHAGEGHHSLYLCLFGRDLKAGETAEARARLMVRPLPEDKDAEALYVAYLEAE